MHTPRARGGGAANSGIGRRPRCRPRATWSGPPGLQECLGLSLIRPPSASRSSRSRPGRRPEIACARCRDLVEPGDEGALSNQHKVVGATPAHLVLTWIIACLEPQALGGLVRHSRPPASSSARSSGSGAMGRTSPGAVQEPCLERRRPINIWCDRKQREKPFPGLVGGPDVGRAPARQGVELDPPALGLDPGPGVALKSLAPVDPNPMRARCKGNTSRIWQQRSGLVRHRVSRKCLPVAEMLAPGKSPASPVDARDQVEKHGGLRAEGRHHGEPAWKFAPDHRVEQRVAIGAPVARGQACRQSRGISSRPTPAAGGPSRSRAAATPM